MDVVTDSAADLGAPLSPEPSLQDEKQYALMMIELHRNLFAKLLVKLQRASVFSVSIGESTGVATKEMLVVYISYVDELGEPHVEFVALPRMFGTDAESTYKTLKKFLGDLNLYSKVVALGSDGASVMTGKDNGVATRLRADISHLLALHCVNHRLALSAGEAAKLVSFSNEIDKLLRGIGRLVRRSAKRQERFKEIAKLYDEAHESIKKLHAMRWLSQCQVLKSITENINTIADLAREMMATSTSGVDDDDEEAAFDDEANDAKAFGPKEVYERLTNFKYVGALFFLTDLMSVVNMVSVSFQYALMESSVSFVSSQISLLKKHVEGYMPRTEIKSHARTAKFLESIDGLDGDLDAGETRTFKIGKSKGIVTDENRSEFFDFVVEYALAFRSCLEERFPNDELISAFAVFEPAKIHGCIDVDSYGMAEIKMLAEHYKDHELMNLSTVYEEWMAVAHIMFDWHKSNPSGSMSTGPTSRAMPIRRVVDRGRRDPADVERHERVWLLQDELHQREALHEHAFGRGHHR